MENNQKIGIGGGSVFEYEQFEREKNEVVKSSGMKDNYVVAGGLGKAVQGQGSIVQGSVKAVSPNAIGVKISDLSDDQLYKKCVECGVNAKEWIRKFAAMLPEVEKRGLHRKKGFTSIYEFAKKLAGMGDFTVDRILRLVKRIADKPVLLSQFESGKQSWSKIETVSYIATKETEEALAKKIETMPQRALAAYVSQKREEEVSNVAVALKNKMIFGQSFWSEIHGEMQNGNLGSDENGFEKKLGSDGNMLINYQDAQREDRYKIFLFHASIDVQFKLRLFKQRLEKERKQSLSWNEVFEVLLRKLEDRRRYEEIKNAGKIGDNVEEKMREYNANRGKSGFVKYVKDEVGEEKIGSKNDLKLDHKKLENAPSRHIPVELKRQILAKYGYKCGFPKCNFPCFVLHHTKRFVLFSRHDAESIVPLCKQHHDLVHSGCILNEEDVPEKWVLKKIGEEGKTIDEGKTAEEVNGVIVGTGSNNVASKVANDIGESIIVDKHTGEVLDTKEKVDAVVMKYKMKNVRL